LVFGGFGALREWARGSWGLGSNGFSGLRALVFRVQGLMSYTMSYIRTRASFVAAYIPLPRTHRRYLKTGDGHDPISVPLLPLTTSARLQPYKTVLVRGGRLEDLVTKSPVVFRHKLHIEYCRQKLSRSVSSHRRHYLFPRLSEALATHSTTAPSIPDLKTVTSTP